MNSFFSLYFYNEFWVNKVKGLSFKILMNYVKSCLLPKKGFKYNENTAPQILNT